ncbi:uncharacterized protein LOC131245559 [Magnolia sinica]|uniref:uncharacterized protein LOC131245559 n=1 Tax=Magnolia sinica TaxID=86752 RepID=UPI0026592243|nr:uncharacterized protein LOC131245559 [Magnolia sinica]
MLLHNADSAELKRSDCLKEIGDRSESHSCCSTKEEMDEETSTGNEHCVRGVKDPSQGMSAKVPETDDGLHEQESSQLTTVPEAHLAMNEHRYLPSFDLNEDVQTEEVECSEKSVTTTPSSCHVTNLSAPIPVVATSRGLACLPTTPLQFEGELGWRGSAATSAFRPAKTHDKE